MNAYEFTRFEADKVNTLKAKGYDIDTVAYLIDYNNPDKNYFRDTKEYQEAQDVFYELTMSCNLKERIGWMKRWMLNAIAYGFSKDLNWRAFFMAAYDIHSNLITEAVMMNKEEN